MDDEAETYKLWRVRKTIMQVSTNSTFHISYLKKVMLKAKTNV